MAPQWQCVEEKVSGRKFYRVTTESLRDFLTNEVVSYWEGEQHDNKKRFPGAQPVSIERKNYRMIKGEPYVVCAKLDGERFLMFMTRVPEDIAHPEGAMLNVTFMVSRNLHFYIVTGCWSREVYEGKTLLDGELLSNGEFVIHDAIVIAGETVKPRLWEYRWKTVDNFLQRQNTGAKENTLRVRLKKFYRVKSLKGLFREIEEKKIESDGLVFYPMKDGVKYRNQPNLFKWKPPGHHTVDFKVEVEGEKVKLMTWGNRQNLEYDSLSLMVFEGMEEVKTGDVVEFGTVMNGGKICFVPIKKREDKPVGNNLYTVRKTLLNVKENITKEELIRTFS